MKQYYIQYNIGKSKYVVNDHDGEKKHPDGSDFYDISIFKNKKKLTEYIRLLRSNGYVERAADFTRLIIDSDTDEDKNYRGESIFDHPVWDWAESNMTPEQD